MCSENSRGFFITGTDTGVGKSEVAAALCALFAEKGFEVHPRKPVESGCLIEHQGEALFPQDGHTLQIASQSKDSLAEITPFRFSQPISPERAARLSGEHVSLQQLVNCCQPPMQSENSIRVVEGAGGFYSPIAEQLLNADLASTLNLPVILVAEDRLGGINQVLLTRSAILEKGLQLKCIILNNRLNTTTFNIKELENWVQEPLITLPIIQHHKRPWQVMKESLDPFFYKNASD